MTPVTSEPEYDMTDLRFLAIARERGDGRCPHPSALDVAMTEPRRGKGRWRLSTT